MAKKKMKWYEVTALVLVIVGALNWGLVGAFSFDLVKAIFGSGLLSRIIYSLVGISGLYTLGWVLMKK